MSSFKQQADRIGKMVSNTDNYIDVVARKLGLANQHLANGLNFQKQRDAFAKEIVIHPFFKNMQHNFFKAIFPIGGTILSACNELLNSDIMTPKQRDELAGIGNKIISLPYRIITGEIDVKKGFAEFVGALKSLASFFFKHKEVALKIGGKILKSMHPLGSFLKSTVEKVVKSDLGKNLKEGLMRGLNITAEHFGKVEKVLENTAVAKVSPKHS